jgi:hypothetical protein
MWDEDPRRQEGHWRTVAILLKVTVAFAAGLSLVFGIWEPLVSALTTLGGAVGLLFVAWVVPMWLLGKMIEQLARVANSLRREKSLKPRPN